MSTANWTTFDVIGDVEDVTDIITDISPEDTPLYTLATKGTCHNVLVEFQEHELEAPAANAQIEGADAPAAANKATTMFNNHTQILEKVAKVSDSARSQDQYGRSDELGFQVANRARALKNDVEFAFTGDATQAGNAGADGATARTMASAQYQVKTNGSSATTTASAGPAGLEEQDVLDTHRKCYDAGGDPSVLLISPSEALSVAAFASNSTTYGDRLRDIENGTTLVNAIDVYQSPFGTLSVVMSRKLDVTTAMLIDPDYWEASHLRPFGVSPLSRNGAYERRLIDCELTLKCLNSKANGLIEGLDTP